MSPPRRLLFSLLGALGWLLFGFMTWSVLNAGQGSFHGNVFQVDWHVFWAGARDLVDRDLYRVPLDAGGLPLSATEFRLPPLAAVWPLPLLPLPEETGGIVWQVVGAASIAVATIIPFVVAGARRSWLLAGMVLGPLSLTLLYLEGLHLATNNYLVLGLVALGAWRYLRGDDRWAGVLIGLATATKLWPAVLLVVAVRDGRWHAARWMVGTVAVEAVVLLAWLGPDVIGPMISTLGVDIPPTGLLIGPSAFPVLRDIWNGGLGVLVAIGLLALPLRGPALVGTAIIAGMAPIGNLWIHYAPTILFGFGLVVADAVNHWSSLASARSRLRSA